MKTTFILTLAALFCLPAMRIQAQHPSLTIHQLVPADLLYLKNLVNFTMTCLSANGTCVDETANISAFIPEKGSAHKYKSKSENDLAYPFLLKFGGLNFFIGGHPSGGGKYAVGKTPLCQALRTSNPRGFHVYVCKVDHHGSAHSTNDSLVAILNPTLAIIPTAPPSFSRTPLPTNATVSKLSTANNSINYTVIPDNPAAGVNYQARGALQGVLLSITNIPGAGVNVTMNLLLPQGIQPTVV